MASKDRDAVRAQQERVQSLLIDTVTLLCKNSIQYEDELKVEGLLGITVDKEVFLVNISEKFQEEKEEEPEPEPDPVEKASPRGTKRSHDMSPAPSPTKQSSRVDQVKVKTEVTDDDEDLVIVKDEGIRLPTGERRVPPLHGASDDYNYSMDYGYGPDSGGGEPPTKQRRSGPGQSFHSGDSSHSSDSFMDPNFANLAAQVSQEVTGDGSFDAGGNWQPQPGTSQGNMMLRWSSGLNPGTTGSVNTRPGGVNIGSTGVSLSPHNQGVKGYPPTVPPSMPSLVSAGIPSVKMSQSDGEPGVKTIPHMNTNLPGSFQAVNTSGLHSPVSAMVTSLMGGGGEKRNPVPLQDRNFVCPKEGCGRRYQHKQDLTYHMRLKHSGHREHTFVCNIDNCAKQYSHPSALYLHQRQKHGRTLAARPPPHSAGGEQPLDEET